MIKVIIITLILFFSGLVEAKSKKPPPTIPTVSYALYNVDQNQYVTGSNEGEIRPMASITKLMSALVTLRKDLALDEVLTVTGTEASPRITKGMKLTREQLLELALVSSDNLAARTLAETYPGGYYQFIEDMNITANELGMNETRYTDSTGLLSTNTSSIDDIRKLVIAIMPFKIFTITSNTTKYAFESTLQNKNKVKKVTVQGANTNFFAGKLDIIAAKTGYTSRAGRCLTMLFNHQGMRYLLVVMGAQTPDQRKKMVEHLIDLVK